MDQFVGYVKSDGGERQILAGRGFHTVLIENRGEAFVTLFDSQENKFALHPGCGMYVRAARLWAKAEHAYTLNVTHIPETSITVNSAS